MKKILLLLLVFPLFLSCSSDDDDEDRKNQMKKEITDYLSIVSPGQVSILEYKEFNVEFEKSELSVFFIEQPNNYTNKHYCVKYRFVNEDNKINNHTGDAYLNERYEVISLWSIEEERAY